MYVYVLHVITVSSHTHVNVAAALLGQEIFVAGGQADSEVINSAEIYNPELNQWEQMVARLEIPRVGLTMVSMGNLIYAIGEYCMCLFYPHTHAREASIVHYQLCYKTFIASSLTVDICASEGYSS